MVNILAVNRNQPEPEKIGVWFMNHQARELYKCPNCSLVVEVVVPCGCDEDCLYYIERHQDWRQADDQVRG